MKPQLKTACFVLLIALAVAAGWWLSRPHQTSVPAAETKAAPPRTTVPQSPPKADELPKIVQPYAHTPMLNLADPRWKDYEIKRKADPSWEWKTPIEFYGKVIDERDQPIAGAAIEVSWSGTVEKYGRDGVGHRVLSSNANGLFELTDVEGKGITVRVSKDGYYTRKTSNSSWFEYAGFGNQLLSSQIAIILWSSIW